MIDGPDVEAYVESVNDKPGDQTSNYFAADFQEASKLQEFYPQNGKAWWENAASYGMTKAIDAAFGPKIAGSGGQQATYAGQDGRTYTNGKTNAAKKSSDDLLMLLGLGALAMFALN